ncbi:hypothetical protein [Mucilaginibacter phyllosphaerae]|uniref:Uncharacterized protein n=1 Tax=Mucilaginibacter phyllosphaerae TaxID=1812349 RepID=A0A4Y8AA47_9SPHI|nr:hypothetical protein [Mucilaginibacter phyllosphaerae]MBB3969879.1 hypothetical protein [Mucilaginibacter phyllosphaerae]TEW65253.1 hypothetical protein E2R65_15180 [Mucilaginibacter phyllosphaerae]GGH17021.1 hypothetical protein GCM10007352_26830 [Mucilaginibacter phyllosphaerae]
MSKNTFKPVFERTLSEQSDLIRPHVKKVQLENINRGLYNSYRDGRYKSNDVFIRRYKDHREVVKIDAATGYTKTLRTIK